MHLLTNNFICCKNKLLINQYLFQSCTFVISKMRSNFLSNLLLFLFFFIFFFPTFLSPPPPRKTIARGTRPKWERESASLTWTGAKKTVRANLQFIISVWSYNPIMTCTFLDYSFNGNALLSIPETKRQENKIRAIVLFARLLHYTISRRASQE